MEQEPGKAGEPVPAAPHPDDVRTFEPNMASERPQENGSARSGPLPPAVSGSDSPGAALSPEPTPPISPAGTPDDETPAWEPAPLAGASAALEAVPAGESAPSAGTTPWEPDPSLESSDETPFAVHVAAETAETDLATEPPQPVLAEAEMTPSPGLSVWPSVTADRADETVPLAPAETAEGVAPAAWPEEAPQPVSVVEEPYVETGPNWMLAFVCLWAAGTALNESWYIGRLVGLTPALVRNVTFMGYGVLGLGLLGFALDALQSGKKRSSALCILNALVPALLTLAGVILLVLSNDPGRRI